MLPLLQQASCFCLYFKLLIIFRLRILLFAKFLLDIRPIKTFSSMHVISQHHGTVYVVSYEGAPMQHSYRIEAYKVAQTHSNN